MIIYIFLIVVDEVLLIENCSFFFSFLFMFTLNKHLKPVVYEVCV